MNSTDKPAVEANADTFKTAVDEKILQLTHTRRKLKNQKPVAAEESKPTPKQETISGKAETGAPAAATDGSTAVPSPDT